MIKKFISIVLCLLLVIGISQSKFEVDAATTSQQNIVDRANYLWNSTWVSQKNVYGWQGSYIFYQGSTYRLPYGQPIHSGRYIGYGVSVDDFLAATKNASSVFYTTKSYISSYSSNSTYYATDCSAFVSWCWGIDRKTTYSIPQVSTNLGYANSTNVYNLQIGDCLNSNYVGHVVLVTGLTYNASGTITGIEITEQTPPQLKKTTYTPTSLAAKYGSYYTIQRYSGTVPSAPESSSDTSGSVEIGEYYPACGSSYTSFYPAMESIGISCDWELHCRIAEANGIEDFSGTVEQNTALLNLLKSGELLNPDYDPTATTASTETTETTEATEPTTEAVNKYYPACDSSYSTFYAAMSSIGVDCDWELHCEIAEVNGITDFSGTVEQNTSLLNLLKAGKLINPDYAESTENTEPTESTPKVNVGYGTGYENGYEGGMPGDGKIYAHGLDVSEHQSGNIDFTAVKNAGYDFVIIRAGTSRRKDYNFEEFYEKAKAAGLDVGTYFYSYATTASASAEDAKTMLSWIEGKQFEYPVYLDYEDSSQSSLSTAVAQDICLTFMDAMAEAGYLTGMYTGYYKSTGLPMSVICEKYEFWVANYYDYTYQTLSSSYSSKYGMYQYTDRNYVNGSGPYDANVVYKDYPSIVKKYGFNGYEPSGSWSDDGRYKYDFGSYATGFTEIDGKEYCMDSQGFMKIGWVQRNDEWGFYDITGVLTKTCANMGDVDNSGEIDINDATYIQNKLLRCVKFTEEEMAIADVNGNGRVEIRDATHIQLYLAKYMDYFKLSYV